MIFVGSSGALLWRAVAHARTSGYPVDLVITRPGGVPPAGQLAQVRTTSDVNDIADELRSAGTDGIVWSIDNPFVFRAPVLDLGLRTYNIHGGLLPGYRGIPLATVAYAILNGETEYGVTLHEIDAGVDTGPVIAERRFPVAPDDGFEDVMLQVVAEAHQLFVDSLETVAAGRAVGRPQRDGPSGYYGLRRAKELDQHRDHPNYARATGLGLFADFFPEAASAWA